MKPRLKGGLKIHDYPCSPSLEGRGLEGSLERRVWGLPDESFCHLHAPSISTTEKLSKLHSLHPPTTFLKSRTDHFEPGQLSAAGLPHILQRAPFAECSLVCFLLELDTSLLIIFFHPKRMLCLPVPLRHAVFLLRLLDLCPHLISHRTNSIFLRILQCLRLRLLLCLSFLSLRPCSFPCLSILLLIIVALFHVVEPHVCGLARQLQVDTADHKQLHLSVRRCVCLCSTSGVNSGGVNPVTMAFFAASFSFGDPVISLCFFVGLSARCVAPI